MTLYDNAITEYRRLGKKTELLEQAIDKLPPGSLEWARRGERFRFYQREDGKKRFLSAKKEKELLEDLAKKKYLQKMLMDTRNEKEAIGKYLRTHKKEDHAGDLLIGNPHLNEILSPLFKPLDEKQREWAEVDYPSTANYPEYLIHPGPCGKMFRSKSEAMIAHVLYRHRLAYRYEWDKEINGVVYHIDFTIRHPETDEFIFWEHCGRMDKDGYAVNIGTKIKEFESAGIFPDRNLILTFESRRFPFEIGMAEDIAQKWFPFR